MVRIEEYIKKTLDEITEKELNDFADSILKEREKDAFSLLFATDLHYKSDNELTFGTIKRLREMVSCAELVKPDLFVLNGDLTDGHSEKSRIISELSEIFDCLSALRLPVIINKGNHDSATWFACGEKSSDYIKADEWNMLISGVTKRKETGYGFLDFDKQKIRVIYLNTSDIKNETDESGRIISANCEQWCLGIGTEQTDWLRNVLSSCDHDYSVMFFSHNVPCDAQNPKGKVENGERVWELIRNFARNNKVIAYMYGHRHRDSLDIVDGIPCICIKDMVNAQVAAEDKTVFCATLKDIPVICNEPVLNNPLAEIIGGWDYVEIGKNSFKSKRFLLPDHNRSIVL